jgi:phosphate transport system substrate-binding protein
MSAAERAQCAHAGVTRIAEVRIGYDSLIIADKATSASFNVTLDQLWRAAAKSVPVGGVFVRNPYRNWREIARSLPDLPIKLLGPAPGHGTRDAFIELVMEPSCMAATRSAPAASAQQKSLCDTVRDDGRWVSVENLELILGKLAGDPQAVGILTYSYLEQFPTRIHAAAVNGVLPARATISSGEYPISRPLFMYVKTAHIASTLGLADYVMEFVSLCAAGAHGYLAEEGLVPMPRNELLTQRAIAAHLPQ